jgi:hypothetical protein
MQARPDADRGPQGGTAIESVPLNARCAVAIGRLVSSGPWRHQLARWDAEAAGGSLRVERVALKQLVGD